MDESKFDEAMRRHPDWVKELFGLDTDADFVIDSGIAYTVNSYTRPFVTTGGILLTKVSTFDGSISRREKEIVDYNRYLEDYERKLKEKYYTMEGTLNTLQESSKALDNLNQGRK
jgi:flagellar capping protein FliD